MARFSIRQHTHFSLLSKAAQAIKTVSSSSSTKQGRIAIDFSIITIVAVVIFRNFIWGGGWPAGGDVLGWVAREYLFGRDFRWLSLWRPYSFGFVEGINSMDFFSMLIYLVFQSGAATVKVFTLLSFIVAGFSMYAFAYRYVRSNLASLAASLIYILNQWLFSQLTEMHVDVLFGYALAPLMFLLLDRALVKGRLKDMIAFALLYSICLTGFYPGSFVIYTAFMGMFVLFYVFTPTQPSVFRNRVRRSAKLVLYCSVLVFLLSAFYLFPFLLNVRARFYSQGFGYYIEEAFTFSYEKMGDAFTLSGREIFGYVYTVDVRREISLQLLPVAAMLFGMFALAYSTVLFKRDRYTLFFLFSGIVSAFLAKGPNPPFESIFTWAWFNIPHFSVFRAASRFAMITAFSNAFFISVLVQMSTRFISKQQGQQSEACRSENNPTPGSASAPRKTSPSSETPYQIMKKLRATFRHFCILLLLLVFSSGFLSCWFFFQNGLQVYCPPTNFLTPYEWLAKQQGDFKVVSVSRASQEWDYSGTLSDFAFSGMMTPIGWGHDIGYESPFIHDKPVLQDGGWELNARMFLWHVRFHQVRSTTTSKLLKMLGTFNYRYVALPSYISQDLRAFFLNQEGASVVYNHTGAIVIENAFHTPEIFGATQHIMIVGGYRSLFSLLKVDSYNPSQTATVFVDQLGASGSFDDTALSDSKALLLADGDLMDLVMLSSEDMNVKLAAQFGVASVNYSQNWGSGSSWNELGSLVLGRNTLTTSGNCRATIPFEVKTDGDCEVLIRVGYMHSRGRLGVYVDGFPLGVIYPNAESWTNLKWTNAGSLYLEKGQHTLALTNDGTGWNDIDAVAVVNSATLKQRVDEMTRRIENYSGRIIYLMDSAYTFSSQLPAGWHLASVPYQEEMVESSFSSTLNTSKLIPRAGWFRVAARVAYGPEFGNITVRFANSTATVSCNEVSDGFRWADFGTAYLQPGNLTIFVDSSGHVRLDELALYSINGTDDVTHFNDLFVAEQESPLVTWNKIDEVEYVAHVRTDRPFCLVFCEAYHPLWKAFIDNQAVAPVVVYSVVNGFFINRTGEFDVTIRFTGQDSADIGLNVSAVTVSGVLIYLVVYPPLRYMLKKRHRWEKH